MSSISRTSIWSHARRNPSIAIKPIRRLHATPPTPASSPLLNLSGLSTSRENRHFAKVSGLSSIEHSPALQLTRSSEGLDEKTDINSGASLDGTRNDDGKLNTMVQAEQNDAQSAKAYHAARADPVTPQESSMCYRDAVQFEKHSSWLSSALGTDGTPPTVGALLESWKSQQEELRTLREAIMKNQFTHSAPNKDPAEDEGSEDERAPTAIRGSNFGRLVALLTVCLATYAFFSYESSSKVYPAKQSSPSPRRYLGRESRNPKSNTSESCGDHECESCTNLLRWHILDLFSFWDPESRKPSK
ncbi:MAG: hypothetical protein M1831_002969 [Alyxoria varia]|nr:MAG: hypothetical protein M1831_002969 [Alyxoria varia]